VLRICAGPGETTISDIGRGLGITRQGASKIIAGMKDRGYVTVTPSEADGREKIITLTPRAVEFLTALHRASAAIEERVRQELGPEGTEQFVRSLNVLAAGEAEPAEPRTDSPAIRTLRWLDASDRL
jgi:DNA-binding MarR family transcriptional regulator